MNGKSSFLTLAIVLVFNILIKSQSITIPQYIDRYRAIAIRNMLDFKIPASITLAQGILESANGNSDLAVQANNHFGIKCHKDWLGKTYLKTDDKENECFRVYDAPEESFADHARFLSTRKRYASLFLLDKNDYKAWAQSLKDAGYATNPQYPQLLIKIIETNNLWQYDTNYSPFLADAEKIKFKDKPVIMSSQDNEDDFEPVSFGLTGRKVFLNNEIKFVFARKGDRIEDLARELGVFPRELVRYNDFDENHKFQDGEIVYIQPKRCKGFAEYHIVKEGDTMLSISQFYGIKLNQLYSKNKMEKGSQPKVGQRLWLKKKKKEMGE